MPICHEHQIKYSNFDGDCPVCSSEENQPRFQGSDSDEFVNAMEGLPIYSQDDGERMAAEIEALTKRNNKLERKLLAREGK